MSTLPYATPVHLLLIAFVLALIGASTGCGGEVPPDIDQLVHEGPVPQPRPPRPVALERDSGTLVRFSPHDGGISSRLAPLEGAVIDVATDGQVVWALTEGEAGRRVFAVDGAGVVWSRPVFEAVAVAALAEGAVAVFAPHDWWALDSAGGVLWHAPGRPLVQVWSSTEGARVVTRTGRYRSVWSLSTDSPVVEGSYLVDDALLASVPGSDPVALSLSDGQLVVTSLGPDGAGASLPLSAKRLLAAHPVGPNAVALLASDPPTIALLSLRPLDVVTHPLDGPTPSPRGLIVQDRRIFFSTYDGIGALDVVEDVDRVTLTVPHAFEAADLGAPLAGPPGGEGQR